MGPLRSYLGIEKRIRVTGWAAALSLIVVHSTLAENPPEDLSVVAWKNVRQIGDHVSVRLVERDVVLMTVIKDFEPRDKTVPVFINQTFNLPARSVVTSVAIRTGRTWRSGKLMKEAQSGRQAVGVNAPWAAVDWNDSHSITIVTSMFRTSNVIRVRYTLWSQAEADEKILRWSYCGEDADERAPDVMIAPGGVPVRVQQEQDAKNCFTIERDRPVPKVSLIRFGAIRLSRYASWWRLELDLSDRLWPQIKRPRPEQTVFVLDSSRSQQLRGGLANQLAIVRAFLSAQPDSEAELIVADRTAERVFGRFVAAAEFDETLPADLSSRPLRNGSFVDRGLDLALDTLKRSGQAGRIVIMTDKKVRSALSASSLVSAVRRSQTKATVFMIDPFEGNRDSVNTETPEGIAAALAELDGGVFRVTVGTKPGADGDLAAGLRRLVDDDQIEQMALRDMSRPGHPEWPVGLTSPLMGSGPAFAGTFSEWHAISRTPVPNRLALTGSIWGKERVFAVRSDPVLARRMARLALTDEHVTECADTTRPERTALIEGFLGPGLSFDVAGKGWTRYLRQTSSYGPNCVEPIILPRTPRPSPPPVQHEVDPFPIEPAAARCRVAVASASGDIRLRIETWDQEVVDVSAIGGDADVRQCLEEAVWDVTLPSAFNAQQGKRIDYAITLSRK